jgi:putative ABC transport system ATP-binding protein
MPAVVELDHASKLYRANGNVVYAVREACLTLEPRSFTAVMGRSGCGKSTLLNLAGAVDLPTSGRVRIGERQTSELNDDELSGLRRRQVGFVFQFFHLLPTLTVAENVELPLLLEQRRKTAKGEERVRSLLEVAGLAAKAAQYPHQLSGGEMQRAAIARALAHNPTVIIADEPTGNLDSTNAEKVLRLLQHMSREQGCAVLMATHSREAASYAGRVIEMKDGQLLNV